MQKIVYTVMQDWEIKGKNKKQQWFNWKLMIQGQKCNAPPNHRLVWANAKWKKNY